MNLNPMRLMVDLGIGAMAVSGLIAWGASQAERQRLIVDVSALHDKMPIQIENKTKIGEMHTQIRENSKELSDMKSMLFEIRGSMKNIEKRYAQ